MPVIMVENIPKPKKKFYPKQEQESWPVGYRGCSSCGTVKPLVEFHLNARGLFGRDANCRICTSAKKSHSLITPTLAAKAAWPEGHRLCTKCGRILPFSAFGKHSKGLFGIDCRCRECRKPKSAAGYIHRSYEHHIFDRARSRASKKGLDFDIEVSDIVIPEFCPALGIPLVRATGHLTDNSPSIDRIDSTKGYIKGNIAIISNRANRIKSNSTPTELRRIANWAEDTLLCGI